MGKSVVEGKAQENPKAVIGRRYWVPCARSNILPAQPSHLKLSEAQSKVLMSDILVLVIDSTLDLDLVFFETNNREIDLVFLRKPGVF